MGGGGAQNMQVMEKRVDFTWKSREVCGTELLEATKHSAFINGHLFGSKEFLLHFSSFLPPLPAVLEMGFPLTQASLRLVI